jgi:O-acetyl-ADP-ribose deacetylase (regulator of RNase III)
MVLITEGNIFESSVNMIVNPVNCVGVMGKGLAKEFSKKYPTMFEYYSAYCKSNRLFIGSLYVYKCPQIKKPNYIACFPTKIHYRDPSRYSFISKGLKALRTEIEKRNIRSIALPALGCGLGELDFTEVLRLMVDNLTHLKNVKTFVYKPLKG